MGLIVFPGMALQPLSGEESSSSLSGRGSVRRHNGLQRNFGFNGNGSYAASHQVIREAEREARQMRTSLGRFHYLNLNAVDTTNLKMA